MTLIGCVCVARSLYFKRTIFTRINNRTAITVFRFVSFLLSLHFDTIDCISLSQINIHSFSFCEIDAVSYLLTHFGYLFSPSTFFPSFARFLLKIYEPIERNRTQPISRAFGAAHSNLRVSICEGRKNEMRRSDELSKSLKKC